MNHAFLGLSVFLACIVEMVEALTIVLALGISRGWRSALVATAAAIATLGLLLLLFEPTLQRLSAESGIAIRRIWLVMGGLLLVFGIQWLRKAVLRYSGFMALHDEDDAFEKARRESERKKSHKKVIGNIDWYAFTVVFKGVLIEGLEVIFIVITFGATQGTIGVGAAAAAAAFSVVVLLGLLLHKPLSRIPENSMKFAVGIIITTFGTFFAAQGAGIIWLEGQLAIVKILVFYLAVCTILVVLLTDAKKSVDHKLKART